MSPQHPKRPTSASPKPTGRDARDLKKERRARQRAQAALSGALVVYPLNEWSMLRGISVPQARRLIADGRVKVTHLSERRIGIRSDHDLEYLDSCLQGGA